MNNKVYILTIHHIPNFGSLLQAYALQRFLAINHIPSEIIDYRPKYYREGKSKIKALLKNILLRRSNQIIEKKTSAFIDRYVKLTGKRYSTLDDLKTIEAHESDIFIAGGDQLWNPFHPCGRDVAYKLQFASKGKKMSYGTSIGRNDLSEAEIGSLVAQVSQFSSIGLREISTVKMLQNRQLTNLYHAVDPVLLLDKAEYLSLQNKPGIDKPYAVFYMIKSSRIIDILVDKARMNGLHVIQIGGHQKECHCDERLLELSPNEMLGYLTGAQCVVSNSFHATVFSVLFNIPFYSLLPHQSTNARIIDFLTQLNLGSQIVDDENKIGDMPPQIDFSEANVILHTLIDASKNRLLSELSLLLGNQYEQN